MKMDVNMVNNGDQTERKRHNTCKLLQVHLVDRK